MITVTFQATTAENLIRQITAFIEKMEGGENGAKGKTHRKGDTDMGRKQQQ